jgi:hypothetical protein
MTPTAHLRLFSKPREPCECELDRVRRPAPHDRREDRSGC